MENGVFFKKPFYVTYSRTFVPSTKNLINPKQPKPWLLSAARKLAVFHGMRSLRILLLRTCLGIQ